MGSQDAASEAFSGPSGTSTHDSPIACERDGTLEIDASHDQTLVSDAIHSIDEWSGNGTQLLCLCYCPYWHRLKVARRRDKQVCAIAPELAAHLSVDIRVNAEKRSGQRGSDCEAGKR
jgi:hypothetical protein